MAKLFKFEVVTPMRKFFVGDVASIVFETENGQMGVMADHIPMLVANKEGNKICIYYRRIYRNNWKKSNRYSR